MLHFDTKPCVWETRIVRLSFKRNSYVILSKKQLFNSRLSAVNKLDSCLPNKQLGYCHVKKYLNCLAKFHADILEHSSCIFSQCDKNTIYIFMFNGILISEQADVLVVEECDGNNEEEHKKLIPHDMYYSYEELCSRPFITADSNIPQNLLHLSYPQQLTLNKIYTILLFMLPVKSVK